LFSKERFVDSLSLWYKAPANKAILKITRTD
jgi:hypothetical protein